MFTTGDYSRFVTYNGFAPGTNGALFEKPGVPGVPAGGEVRANEHWVARVNDGGWGVGLFSPQLVEYAYSYLVDGPPYRPEGWSAGYAGGRSWEILDNQITFEYEYDIILGNLGTIRAWSLEHTPADQRPDYHFQKDRQLWHYGSNSSGDTGFPEIEANGFLRVELNDDAKEMHGPFSAFRAEDVQKIYIRAAYHLNNPAPGDAVGTLYWQKNISEYDSGWTPAIESA